MEKVGKTNFSFDGGSNVRKPAKLFWVNMADSFTMITVSLILFIKHVVWKRD